MDCICPKCQAEITPNLPSSPFKGGMVTCPDCNKRFWMQRESFILRPFHKDWKIFCANCGEELEENLVCLGCGELYPDYWLVQNTKPAPRKAVGGGDFEFFPSTPRVKRSASYGQDLPFSFDFSFGGGKFLQTIGLVVVAALVIGGGVFLYQKAQKKKQYVNDFVVALYGVKSGYELSLDKSKKIASGKIISNEELVALNTVKREVDAALQQVNHPSESYVQANQKLSDVYEAYSSLYTISTSPSGNADMNEAIALCESQFDQAARELKAELPEDIKTQLKSSVMKYRNLQFMVE